MKPFIEPCPFSRACGFRRNQIYCPTCRYYDPVLVIKIKIPKVIKKMLKRYDE